MLPLGVTAFSDPISIIDELVASEQNVLVQRDVYFRFARGGLSIWTLSIFLILYVVVGASLGAIRHAVSFMTALFYGKYPKHTYLLGSSSPRTTAEKYYYFNDNVWIVF